MTTNSPLRRMWYRLATVGLIWSSGLCWSTTVATHQHGDHPSDMGGDGTRTSARVRASHPDSQSHDVQSNDRWQSFSHQFQQPKQRRAAITATKASAADLAATLAGPGLTITNATFLVGSSEQFGIFDQAGSGGIGMNGGIVLSTGLVEAPGSTEVGGDGYTPLKQFISGGYISRDAAVLEIQFTCDNADADAFDFTYVFASNEYNEYVNDVWNDV